MFSGLLGGILSPVSGVGVGLKPVTDTVQGVADTAGGIGDQLSPGFTHWGATTGNISGTSGAVEDLLSGLGEGSISSAGMDVYDDVFAPGGIINNLGDGYGLGLEGLLGTALGTVDGVTGPGGGLLDGLLS
ncbi:hypothetical protein [Nitratireductor luteus]|uniref:hypothetical protein n=1 Tax=Nitratireductor luteus TaxID=2976980 RepID=UPI00223ED3EE|nr:hypothetical protein [Nitratireductor luteus]